MIRPINLSISLTLFLSSLLLSGFGKVVSTARTEVETSLTDASAPVETCPVGTVAYWPLDDIHVGDPPFNFDEIAGDPGLVGTCSDLEKCPVSMKGKINTAFYFNGDDQVAVADADELDFEIEDSFSFEMWVKTSQACPGEGLENRKVFIGKYGGTSSSSWWVGCSNAAAAFSLRSAVGSETEISGTEAFDDNEWHYVVAAREATGAGEGENRLYVDGIEVAAEARTYTGTFANDLPMTFGFHDNSYFYEGVLDEVAIYNRALSAEEINDHYNGGKGISLCKDSWGIFLPVVSRSNQVIEEVLFGK